MSDTSVMCVTQEPALLPEWVCTFKTAIPQPYDFIAHNVLENSWQKGTSVATSLWFTEINKFSIGISIKFQKILFLKIFSEEEGICRPLNL